MKQKLIWMIVFLFLGVTILSAHAPKKNELTFDRQQLSLKVKTIHPVSNVKSHHVKKIAVLLNGKEIASQEFEQQQNNEFQEWEFKFGPEVYLPKGAELTVVSRCNIFGKKKTTITLE